MHGLLLFAIYLLPFLVALARHNVNTTGIFIVNFFLGWTGIGWIVALLWACCGASWRQYYYPARW
jgi:hypothetical protein